MNPMPWNLQETTEVQSRLVALVELLERLTPWCGDPRAAYGWYCSRPLAGFEGKTARDLVRSGRMTAVEAYLERIAVGGYAWALPLPMVP